METIIDIKHLNKIYNLYDKPIDRLKDINVTIRNIMR